ncbi:hypothetical protein D0Z07_3911 [Hyphodiscus hymeniophilus]|uniref:PhoD-like phosphatase domain-containing protein n=1 Tax=Hyphodiscus hymeniophilus TaxID=353542 RepID=A0A9P6VKN2_9HELO|nr:hypothetical protein D0Z07_3911 [Hyphodiscus hymeniophilus]
MASHLRDNILHGENHEEEHASANRWRHQESRSYAHHASPREADERHGSNDLANFLNTSRVHPPKSSGLARAERHKPIAVASNSHNGGIQQGAGNAREQGSQDSHTVLEVKCGPLLNYRRMENETWFGSVLIVTKGGGLGGGLEPQMIWKATVKTPASGSASSAGIESSSMNLNGSNKPSGEPHRKINGVDYTNTRGPDSSAQGQDNTNATNDTANSASAYGASEPKETRVPGVKLYSDPGNTFWQFDLQIPMRNSEIQCHYSIPGLNFTHGAKTDRQSFFIPAITESMRIMFHSCNGFSVGTDEKAWSGAALWNDVMRVHQKRPFHVMLGGGDQIYNDGIRVKGPLRQWTDISNPIKRREFPFPEDLRRECDEYYVNNYINWYGTEPFASANGKIPQVNLWDDHDIIDGFGSYTDDFMKCAVFRGIGGVAHKYYLLFQHHLAPPLSTYTTGDDVAAPDPRQLENTYVLQQKTIDSSYIIGPKPGKPYVMEHSRSIYARLGARIGFFGIDARTEQQRTRHQVNYPETYDVIFSRLRQELGAAASSPSPIQHLVVLLGIPIAYPRLTWLENIFSSPIMGPLKFMNKRFGFGGGFFNHFDGSVDLLDDLDDHYTARTHKKERLYIVHQLQALAAEFSIRISILGGDVHLAAVGRFYSNPKLNVPISGDHRYMANIISSAIVNKPPPQAVANLLARRNKIHHLDQETDETLINFFDKDPGNSNKTSSSNHVTMPSRNWAMITECSETGRNTSEHAMNGHVISDDPVAMHTDTIPQVKDGHSWLHRGEVGAGTTHKAADTAAHGTDTDGSLDVMIRVEKDQHDAMGKTQAYGMTIPRLHYEGAADGRLRKRDNIQGAYNQRV